MSYPNSVPLTLVAWWTYSESPESNLSWKDKALLDVHFKTTCNEGCCEKQEWLQKLLTRKFMLKSWDRCTTKQWFRTLLESDFYTETEFTVAWIRLVCLEALQKNALRFLNGHCQLNGGREVLYVGMFRIIQMTGVTKHPVAFRPQGIILWGIQCFNQFMARELSGERQ